MDKIKTIVWKEWSEVFKNRLVLFSVGFLPLLFVALPVITLYIGGDAGTAAGGMEEALPGTEELCRGLTVAECSQLYLLNLYAFMFMILPVAIPVTIAAYSIVGEKTTRSLEPLLATPITTEELLAGKALAAIIPAVAATWISYGLFVVATGLLVGRSGVLFLLEPLWLLAILLVGPLMTLLAVSIAMMVSSRVSDPRVAEQLSMFIILPVILGIIGQSVGVVLIDRQFVLIVAVVVAIIDVILLFFGVKAFQREAILTRWK